MTYRLFGRCDDVVSSHALRILADDEIPLGLDGTDEIAGLEAVLGGLDDRLRCLDDPLGEFQAIRLRSTGFTQMRCNRLFGLRGILVDLTG